jgi:mono/diheme cytochrome c family protein
MKIKIIIFSVAGLIVFGSVAKADHNPSLDDGKSIFTTRCAGCHNINKILTGPALAGVDARHTIVWILNFVHSSQSMVKKGDKDAVALFEKFNKITMPDHPDLTVENIKNVLEYIKSESKSVTEDKSPFAKPRQKKPNYIPLSITKDYGLFIGFFAVVFMLIGSLLFAVQVGTLKGD